MPSESKKNKIVCITGMHRSGTSLMANFLQRCGVDMGDLDHSPKHGNRHGLHEDRAFLDCHARLLRKNRSNVYIPRGKMLYDKGDMDTAEKIINSRCDASQLWGWKDPRTSLFLDLWGQVAPDAKFVCLYREPHKVVDSLWRRMNKYRSKYRLVMPWIGYEAWLRYNKALITFIEKHKHHVLLLNIEAFNNKPETGENVLGRFLGIELEVPYSDVYHSSDIKSSGSIEGGHVYQVYEAVVRSLYQKKLSLLMERLDQLAGIKSLTGNRI